MKKQTKIIIGIVVLIVVGIVGFLLVDNYESTTGFLKAHETEITNEIKQRNSNVARVSYDWNTVKTENSGAFTQEFFDVEVDVYNSKNVNFDGGWVGVYVDNMSHPTKITSMSIPDFSEE